ncbi:Zinc/iron permease [Trichodelitschia bisporula]|uniref:Zinc/iron permease n=1 Tax=Trichodelitschia bisporula TaxID=703511 RepID=A0A6G1HN86_9PEZI|nr:Zinc/iron permease [Trichodelitschia bisporula]
MSADNPWLDIPTSLLRAELARRAEDPPRPECGGKSRGVYNTPLHVAALVLILVLSTVACAFPIAIRHFPRLPVPHYFLFLSRHFGTGVLIATAFVHLFPTAYLSLTDPCLPPFWTKTYPAMPGLIAMASVLVVVGIEMFFATRGAGHVHAHGHELSPFVDNDPPPRTSRVLSTGSASFRRFREADWRADGSSENLIGGASALVSPAPKDASPRHSLDSDDDDDGLDLAPHEHGPGLLNGGPKRQNSLGPHAGASLPTHHPLDPPAPLTAAAHQKALLQCLLLEAGILFHSVFIGMALSVSTGPPFAVLLVAISFHQTFEGLALGSRIAALAFPPSSPKPWLMALAYGTTTPLGQAVGLAVHRLYDPASQGGLLMVGCMNAVSSGLLLFAGLVELLAEDFLSEGSYASLRGKRRIEACAAVVGGATLMALVGAWA